MKTTATVEPTHGMFTYVIFTQSHLCFIMLEIEFTVRTCQVHAALFGDETEAAPYGELLS